MKAIQVREFGDSSVLQLVDIPDPEPRPGEVLVHVKAAGVNYADIMMRSGSYGGANRPPFVPGFEAAGVVLQTGKGVSEWKKGQHVMGTVLRQTCGCYAEKAVMPAWLLMPVPSYFTFEEAAAFPEVFITAYLALDVFGQLSKGESVLIHAAGGAVGTAAVQLAHAAGARVFATASSDEKLRKVKDLGADVLINYAAKDFAEEVKHGTAERGVDLVLDGVGGEVFEKSLKCLQPLGRIVSYGIASGQASSAAIRDLMQRSISVSGFSFGGLSVSRPDLIRDCMRSIATYLQDGKIYPVVGQSFPLAEARTAHEMISRRATYGKVVLVP